MINFDLRPEVPYIDKKPKFRTACLIWFPRKKPQGPRWVFQPLQTDFKQTTGFLRTWMVLRPRPTYPPTFSYSFFPIDLSKSGKLTSWGWGCGNIPLFAKGFLAPSKRWTTRRSSEPSTGTKGTSGFWDAKNKRYQVHVGPSDLGGEESWFLENHSNCNNISPVNLKLWFEIWKVQLRKPYSSSRNHEKSGKRVPPMLAVFHVG